VTTLRRALPPATLPAPHAAASDPLPDRPPAAVGEGAAPAQQALRLLGHLLAGGTLREAAHRLVTMLAEQGGYRRVSLGLRDGGSTVLVAVSDMDPSNPQAELPALLRGAMDEAIDQGLPLVEPPPAPDVPWLRLEQAMLQQRCGGTLATLPLGRDGQPLGAVCVERQGGGIGAAELALLQQQLVLAAPLLALLQHQAWPWHRRLRHGLHDAWASLRQPEQRGRRRLLAAAAAVLAVLALAPLEHDIAGRARLEGAQQRVLVAPTDGFLGAAHVRPGDRVAAGAPLVELMAQDLQLEHERWASQLAQHENAYAAAMAAADRSKSAVALARMDEASAQLALVDAQLGRSRLTAPFDAVVIAGDLGQSIGAPVRQGDTLLTLAAAGPARVIVEVDETEIDRIRPAQRGTLALSSLPWQGHAIVVERISPLAHAVDGRNVFDVEARLLDAGAALRPGLLGRGRITVGRLPPLWAWCGQTADRLRLAWWRWLG